MKLEDIMLRYNLNESELKIINDCMISNSGLKDAEEALSGKLSQSLIFAIAKYVCEFEFLMPIDEMSPRFVTDRAAISERNKDKIQKRIEIAKERKRLAIIAEDKRLFEMEMKAKLYG